MTITEPKNSELLSKWPFWVRKLREEVATIRKGITGPPPEHRWVGTKLQFKNPNGTWGQLVDLAGIKTEETKVT